MRGFLVLISGLNIFSSDHRQGEGVDVSNLLPTIQMTLEGGIRLWLTSLCLLHGSYLCVGSHGICCCLEHLLCCLQVVIIWPHLWYHWTTFNYPLLCMWCWSVSQCLAGSWCTPWWKGGGWQWFYFKSDLFTRSWSVAPNSIRYPVYILSHVTTHLSLYNEWQELPWHAEAGYWLLIRWYCSLLELLQDQDCLTLG